MANIVCDKTNKCIFVCSQEAHLCGPNVKMSSCFPIPRMLKNVSQWIWSCMWLWQ